METPRKGLSHIVLGCRSLCLAIGVTVPDLVLVHCYFPFPSFLGAGALAAGLRWHNPFKSSHRALYRDLLAITLATAATTSHFAGLNSLGHGRAAHPVRRAHDRELPRGDHAAQPSASGAADQEEQGHGGERAS